MFITGKKQKTKQKINSKSLMCEIFLFLSLSLYYQNQQQQPKSNIEWIYWKKNFSFGFSILFNSRIGYIHVCM